MIGDVCIFSSNKAFSGFYVDIIWIKDLDSFIFISLNEFINPINIKQNENNTLFIQRIYHRMG